MNSDVKYLGSLVACIALSTVYKKIENKNSKKIYGSLLGLAVILFVCGRHAHHTIVMSMINTTFIIGFQTKYIHILCMSFSWVYFLCLHLGILSTTQYAMYIHTTVTLRLVGLAFEINTADLLQKHTHMYNQMNLSPNYSPDADMVPFEPEPLDIFYYAYNFIGIHKGPYYRWRTFNDYLTLPFGMLGDYRVLTIRKLKRVGVFFCFYLYLKYQYPIQKYEEIDMYAYKPVAYRLFYNVPQLMRIVIMHLMLWLMSSAVCTECGFVIYPTKCKPMPGVGPTENFSLINAAATHTDVALSQEFNFSTIKNYDPLQIIFGPRMRNTIRGWDMSVQYWFWSNLYRRISYPNRLAKCASTFFFWTFYIGPSFGHSVMSLTLLLYTHCEDIYNDLFRRYSSGTKRMTWDVIFSFVRFVYLIYVTPCMFLESHQLIHYYWSLAFALHIILMAILLLGYILVGKRHRDNAYPSVIQYPTLQNEWLE